MDQFIINEANRLKQQAGQDLENQLKQKFEELVNEGVIKSFAVNQNFAHFGFEYKKQYLANFVLTTLDEKYIVVNSSTSFRQDRVKIQSYDLEGIKSNSPYSKDLIASILLYPDKEIDKNTALSTFRKRFNDKHIYSPATHVLLLTELLEFLENHKSEVELLKEIEEEELLASKDGSYYGVKGNSFEKDVVKELNSTKNITQFKSNGSTDSEIFNLIVSQLCSDKNIQATDIIQISSTNTIKKLKSGGNAKTDIVIELKTESLSVNETISIKTTTRKQVSCHDYRAEDFIRVLGIENTKLADYFNYFQEQGSHEKFINNLPNGYTADEFEWLLNPHSLKLIQWALTGRHDLFNLIDANTQVSNYLLINREKNYRFVKFDNYIQELLNLSNKNYGIPLGWTYPSKQLGKRIQFKLPILME